MTQTLKHQCAQALNCEPDEIMMVKPYETHINIIFTDHRKTAVSRTNLPHVGAHRDAPSTMPIILNDEYQAILDNPKMYDRDQLRQLGAELQIEGAATMNKRPLVTAINKWKQENQTA